VRIELNPANYIFFSFYLIMTHEVNIGSRAQVWHGTAKKTSGGLTKSALMMNKHGRIVSKRKHMTAKKEKRLVKAGFLTKKGHFGFVKHGHSSRRRGRKASRKMRGGMAYGGPLAPLAYDGKGVGTSGVDLQFVAGNAA
jgi:hypothetical protein